MAQSSPETAAKRRASSVLPVPGGPWRSRWRRGARSLRAPRIEAASWSRRDAVSSSKMIPSVRVSFFLPHRQLSGAESCAGPRRKKTMSKVSKIRPRDQKKRPEVENDDSRTNAGLIRYRETNRLASMAASRVEKYPAKTPINDRTSLFSLSGRCFNESKPAAIWSAMAVIASNNFRRASSPRASIIRMFMSSPKRSAAAACLSASTATSTAVFARSASRCDATANSSSSFKSAVVRRRASALVAYSFSRFELSSRIFVSVECSNLNLCSSSSCAMK
mmetsp:Transcript_24012/g.82099  ORF Transcript_24012/g.82099 Transcript_24012/m.82099 type:complete len:277 (-) Transcript_24012:654-1484(-)